MRDLVDYLVVFCIVAGLVALVTGPACSTLAMKAPGVELWCYDEGCPPESQIACISEHFEALFHGWRARDPLRFDWKEPSGECWYASAEGCAPDDYRTEEEDPRVVANTLSLVLHEMHHVEEWRRTGNPNRHHTGKRWVDDEVLSMLALNGCGP